MSQPAALHYEESITIEASPESVYDLVADVTRTGEWSPVCMQCWWEDDAEAGQEGSWFTGHNELPNRIWKTRSQVLAAQRGREFAWAVNGNFVRWGYTLTPTTTGTILTETWDFLPDGLAFFADKYGDDAPAQVADRTRLAHEGIPATLAAIKRIAESGS